MSNELYVLCETDAQRNVIGFVTGGGSSAPSFIRAYESPARARAAMQRIGNKPEYYDVVLFGINEEGLTSGVLNRQPEGVL